MKFFLAVGLYTLTALMIIQNHFVIAAVIALVFSYFNNTAWLIILGFAVDGYFGVFDAVPVYSLLSITWFVLAELARPKLRVGALYE